MQNVSLNDVPEYLRVSPRYLALVESDPNATIQVPDGCLKLDVVIYSHTDFRQFLQTVHFWQVPELAATTASLYHFALGPSHRGSVKASIAEFEGVIPQLDVLKVLIESPSHVQLEVACKHGLFDAIQYLVEVVGVDVTVLSVVAAAAGNHVHCLRYLLSKNRILKNTAFISEIAAENGHLDCLKCCAEFDCRMTECTASAAAKSGCLACMRFLKELASDWDEHTPRFAAYFGHLECLKFACEQFGPWKDEETDTDFYDTFNGVPECEGQVECLHYIQSIGYVVDSTTLETYARKGHNKTLDFLLRHGGAPDVDALTFALTTAIRNNRMETVETLVSHMTPPMRVEYRACEIAVSMYDKVDYLIYFMTNGFPWDLTTMNAAARAGNVEAVSFLRDNGCLWDATTTAAAASGEDELACLTFLHDNGCPWNATTCTAALGRDHEECLAYALSAGCPHDADLHLQAVSKGKRRCLRYLIDSNQIMLSAELPALAARHAMSDVLQLLHERGCPWDERTCTAASLHHHWECFTYAYEHGCPCKVDSHIRSRMYALMNARYADLESQDEAVRQAAIDDMIVTAAMQSTCLYTRFLRDMGHPWSELFTTTAAKHDKVLSLRYALAHNCPAPADLANIAAEHGSEECLEVALEFGFVLTKEVSLRMVLKKKMACLERVRELGFELDVDATNAVAGGGNVLILKWLHEQGAKWDDTTFNAAITRGHLQCVQYMFDNNCPIDFMHSVTLASRHGHLELIKYLRERRLPWTAASCAAAAEGGHLECLAYLRENDCPWDEQTTMLASTQECLEYAVLMGCPNKKNNRHNLNFTG